MKIDFGHIKAMAIKECRHIIRDKFSVAIGLGLPLILIVFFGFIIELNFNHISLFVKDNSQTKESRDFAKKFSGGNLFVSKYIFDDDVVKYFKRNETAFIMIIDKDFGKNFANSALGKKASVEILFDGSDNSKTALSASYLSSIISQNDYEIRTRFLYNPQLKSKWFIVPGLIVIVIGLISILLTSLTIAKEWEKGSMELLLSTHIKPIEIVLGKIFPYFVLTLAETAIVFVAARTIFGVPFMGSIFLFWIFCAIYIVACLSLGILISVITRQQQLAMMVSMALGLLPSMLLSGFIFSIENMPMFFQVLTVALPQRWFMIICRGLFLRGDGFLDLIIPFFALSIFCTLIIIAAAKNFKTDLEP
jgi:ABC-2 type transport system permease protein